jgi:hypothetical protein
VGRHPYPVGAAFLAVVALACGVPASSADGGTHGCVHPGERVVVESAKVVVTKVRRGGRLAYIGCLRRTGKRHRLDIHPYDLQFEVIKPVGTLVAVYYVVLQTDAGGEAIEIHDLATGHVLTPWGASPPGVDFRSIRLRPSGSIAFVRKGGEDELYTCPIATCYAHSGADGDPTLLDHGLIPVSTLRLIGTTLSWQNNGQPRSAQLP